MGPVVGLGQVLYNEGTPTELVLCINPSIKKFYKHHDFCLFGEKYC